MKLVATAVVPTISLFIALLDQQWSHASRTMGVKRSRDPIAACHRWDAPSAIQHVQRAHRFYRLMIICWFFYRSLPRVSQSVSERGAGKSCATEHRFRHQVGDICVSEVMSPRTRPFIYCATRSLLLFRVVYWRSVIIGNVHGVFVVRWLWVDLHTSVFVYNCCYFFRLTGISCSKV